MIRRQLEDFVEKVFLKRDNQINGQNMVTRESTPTFQPKTIKFASKKRDTD